MAKKSTAWLAYAGNGMQMLMVDNGNEPVEATRAMAPWEAAETLARFNAQDWELLNDHRQDALEDAMSHNGNRKKFPDARKPNKGWQLW